MSRRPWETARARSDADLRARQALEEQRWMDLARPIIAAEIRGYIATLYMPTNDDRWGLMLPLVMESCAIVAERGWTPPKKTAPPNAGPLYLADVWDTPP